MSDGKDTDSTDAPPVDGPSGATGNPDSALSGAVEEPDPGSSSQGSPGGEHGDLESGKQSSNP